MSLPVPRGVDADSLLAQYHYALSGESLDALRSVVSKLVKGTWSEEVKFCPRPPELAAMVRREAFALRDMNRPKIAYLPVSQPFKDWRLVHQERAKDLARQGYWLFAENAVLQVRFRGAPTGSIFFWSTGEIWAPPARDVA